MKTSKNTNKIVMKQLLTPTPVFSRVKSLLILPAVLISMFILPLCAGAVQAALANPSISEAEITELENDLRTANTAKTSADGTITTLKEQLTTANNAKASADNMIITLREQLSAAFGDTNTPDGTITTLKEQLTTANNAKASADNMITTLRGQLSTAFRDSNTADAEVIRLTEELRLANERLYALRPAEYSKWVAAVNPDAKPDLANPRHQILQTKDGTLDTMGFTRCADSDDTNESYCGAVGSRTAPEVHNLNLQTSYFDRRFINGDINDGYAFFEGYIGETQYAYLGILDSTDLGAPLTGDAGTSVQWYGNITAQLDFALTITFDVAGGRLDAFVNAGSDRFVRFQNARFDTGGVITGTVILQYFTDSDPTKPIDTATDGDSQTGDSVLSGIIGQEGLVAVAIGANILYGFVAHPDITLNPAVIITDWTRNIGDIRQAFTSVPRNQFLNDGRRTTEVYANSDGTGAVTTEYLDFSRATFNGSPLSRDRIGHIHFFSGYNGGTRHYYAGLGGDLGTTLPVWETGQSASAEWRGQLSVLQGANAVANADLTLEVNFQNRRLTAFVPVGTNHYLLDAGFNADDEGFFAGTVSFGAFTDATNRTSTNTLTSGVLTGLIGVEGAAGVFVSGSTTDNGRTITGGTGENGFAGGFVACPYDETGNRCQQ